MLHSASDSDTEADTAEVAAFFDELSRDAAALESGGPELQRELDEMLEGIQGHVPVDQQRLLQAGVLGVPNAGKSTLVNGLVGRKVSAVSPKTNTTEQSRLGAFTVDAAQVVLYDTPGVVGKEHYMNPTHQQRVRSAWTLAADCELLLFLVDAARELQRPDPRVSRLLADSTSAARLDMPAGWQPPPAVLVLNKVDAIPPRNRLHLLPLADRLQELRKFDDVFFVSAKDGRGLPDLRDFLLDRATPGEWTLDAGMATDRGEEEQALEVVREQLFRKLYKELPYTIQLRLKSCLPRQEDDLVIIEMEALVQHESQKKIVVGSGGATIGSVVMAAERELQEMWGHPVYLSLKVRVDKPA
ncbi:hypothetical protein D9Q98_000676 [Chlorella vulgaris]|uniref:GTP-binding protein Era n=1 Tax=Chlorella vulgaris TaxID=3077 RepID=A0A9D4TZI2_CHLVU|nr:hypothetical protein D9Q98_000676 [Chlorella vulgaris]